MSAKNNQINIISTTKLTTCIEMLVLYSKNLIVSKNGLKQTPTESTIRFWQAIGPINSIGYLSVRMFKKSKVGPRRTFRTNVLKTVFRNVQSLLPTEDYCMLMLPLV